MGLENKPIRKAHDTGRDDQEKKVDEKKGGGYLVDGKGLVQGLLGRVTLIEFEMMIL